MKLTDCPRRAKDVTDKMLLADMMAFAVDNPPPAVIVLISGDKDIAYAVSLLRNHQFSIVVLPPTPTADALLQQANFVFHREELFGKAARPEVIPPTGPNPLKST